MARGPRLDAPGALHHVTARGIERGAIFHDDADRQDFVDRLARLVEARALKVFAWALMPNHAHLLVESGAQELQRSMRALLAGYATRFNRRHDRVGHLFQNRYRSAVCEDETYFSTLLRYVHLNPLPSVVVDVDALARYPWTGHSALLGHVPRPWQETVAVLDRFAPEPDHARLLYARFLCDGVDARETAADGGGFVFGASGWRYVEELRRGRERFASNERILGAEAFVRRTLAELEPTQPGTDLETLIDLVCTRERLPTEALRGPGGPRSITRARRGLAYLWTLVLGKSGRQLAKRLAVCPSAVYQAARKGREEDAYWRRFLSSAVRDPSKLRKL
jgi:putative transposase